MFAFLLILSFCGCTIENFGTLDEKWDEEKSFDDLEEKIPPENEYIKGALPINPEKPAESPVQEKPVESAPVFVPPGLLWTYTTGDKNVDLSMSSGGNLLAVGSYDGFLYLLNNKGELVWRFKVKGSAYGVGITADGRYIILTDFVTPTATIYLLENKNNLESQIVWKKELTDEGFFKAADITLDGSLIVVGNDLGKVIAYNLKGDKLWEYSVGESAWGVWDVCIAEDNHVGIASDDTNIHLLDGSGRILWKRSQGRKSYLYGCSISGNMDSIAGASQDNFIYIYDINGNLKWRTQTKFSNSNVHISDNYMAFSSWDKNIYLYSRNGRLLWTQGMGSEVNDVVISNDEKYLAASTKDKKIYFYKLFQ